MRECAEMTTHDTNAGTATSKTNGAPLSTALATIHAAAGAKMGVWFGITPLWRMGMPSEGISLDVRLEDGRYVLIKE